MILTVVAVSLVISITLVGSGLFLLYCYNHKEFLHTKQYINKKNIDNSYREYIRREQQREERERKQEEEKRERKKQQEEREHEEKNMKKLFLSSLENRIRGGDAEAYHAWIREKNKP